MKDLCCRIWLRVKIHSWKDFQMNLIDFFFLIIIINYQMIELHVLPLDWVLLLQVRWREFLYHIMRSDRWVPVLSSTWKPVERVEAIRITIDINCLVYCWILSGWMDNYRREKEEVFTQLQNNENSKDVYKNWTFWYGTMVSLVISLSSLKFGRRMRSKVSSFSGKNDM